MAKVESKDGTIIGKHCPEFDYTEKKIVTIEAYKKEIMNEFARIRKLTSSQKKMFLHSDLLKLCLKKKWNINEFFPDTTVFYD